MSQKPDKKKAKGRKYFQTSCGVSRHNLITFGIHDDHSLPSDDSDDSSYQPTATEISKVVGKKRKRGKLVLLKARNLKSVIEVDTNTFMCRY